MCRGRGRSRSRRGRSRRVAVVAVAIAQVLLESTPVGSNGSAIRENKTPIHEPRIPRTASSVSHNTGFVRVVMTPLPRVQRLGRQPPPSPRSTPPTPPDREPSCLRSSAARANGRPRGPRKREKHESWPHARLRNVPRTSSSRILASRSEMSWTPSALNSLPARSRSSSTSFGTATGAGAGAGAGTNSGHSYSRGREIDLLSTTAFDLLDQSDRRPADEPLEEALEKAENIIMKAEVGGMAGAGGGRWER